ncbi:MAG: hypothetical protein ACOCUI_05485, partial [bacterium]
MDILDLLRSDGSIIINKKLSHEIGVMENIILSELISQYKYFQSRNELDQEGYFYCTVDKMEKHTALSKDQQSRAIGNLVKMGLIKKDLKGLPARRHFYICENKILDLFLNNDSNNTKNPDNPRHVQIEENPQTGSSETQHQENGKSSNIHNNIYNNKTEEEEARARAKKKIPDKIQQKFNQVFNRELSVEFYEKMLKIYSDTKILFKALRVAEEKADKPCYLLKILKDWQKEGLTSVSS